MNAGGCEEIITAACVASSDASRHISNSYAMNTNKRLGVVQWLYNRGVADIFTARKTPAPSK
jgi:hypothetical protein